MADWTWALHGTPPAGTASRELTKAQSRRAVWRVDDPAAAEFTIDGRSDEIDGLVELGTDLIVLRDGDRLFRGRIGPADDRIGPNRHDTRLSAVDYRGMLDTRIVGAAGETFAGIDQGAIAWALIATTQAQTGGNWGITNGAGPTSGTLRDRTYDPGKPRGEAINELGRVDGGFEWEISPTLELNRWYPRRGADNGVVLDHGGILTSVDRTVNSRDFALSTMAIGAEGLTPAVATAGTVGTDPRGRWELAAGYPSIKEQATLTGRAAWMLGETSTLRPEWAVTFRRGAWDGPDHVWIGDIVTLVVQSGRFAVNDPHRVVEIAVDLDENGVETVSAGLVAA